MKKQIFDYYAISIANQFNITLEELFTQTKTSHIVDARQLLYWLCIERPIKKSYIKNFLNENGYNVSYSTLQYGYDQAKKLIEDDPDFKTMVTRIQENDN
jgi:chromosomal replication initiation ATPase DnaA